MLLGIVAVRWVGNHRALNLLSAYLAVRNFLLIDKRCNANRSLLILNMDKFEFLIMKCDRRQIHLAVHRYPADLIEKPPR